MLRSDMLRHLRLAYLAIGLFLGLMPLSLHKPGVPGGLKADEGAYLMMASSLAFDYDLELTAADTRRLFDEYPLRWVNNVIVFGTEDGQVLYGKPYVYSLFGAPFVRLFGSNGLFTFNLLMLWAMVGLGWRVLAERGAPTVALLFSIGFFCFSACWSYAFWLQPEVFNMFFVMVAMYCGFRWRSAAAPGSPSLFLAGAALALPVYNKPMLLAVVLPILLPIAFEPVTTGRKLRKGLAFTGGLATVGLLLVALSWMLIGHISAYGVSGRQGVKVCGPEDVPRPAIWNANSSSDQGSAAATDPRRVSGARPEQGASSAGGNAIAEAPSTRSADDRSFYWLLRVPEFQPSRWAENVGYFFWGRHTGLLHYFPFAALALLFFVFSRGSTREGRLARWALLAAVGAYVAYFLLFIGWNWQGGGGFIGNRYLVNLIPAMLFLVAAPRPAWLIAPTFAWAGLVIGPLLLSPFGLTVPEPTLQAHTRNWPLRLFPLELTLRNVPGYHSENLAGLRVIARADRALARDGSYVVAARSTTHFLLVSAEPLERLSLQVIGLAPATEVELRLGADWQTIELSEGEARNVELIAGRARRRNAVVGPQQYVYELEVHSDRGVLYSWTRSFPPWPCPGFEFDRDVRETFYAGAEVRLLGPSDELERDVYRVTWGTVIAPSRVVAGSRFNVLVTVTNSSAESWALRGAASVRLSSHWLDQDGEAVIFDGLRSALPPLEPGEQATVRLTVEAPKRPGQYLLELDLVREYVTWFAQQNAGQTYRTPIEVVSAATASADRIVDEAPSEDPEAP